MQALELPFVESRDQPGVVYLLFPGFERESFQGVQYEVYPEEGIVHLFCYREGFEEDGDCEGVSYPVAVPDESRQLVSEMTSLQVVNPETLRREDFEGEDDYERVMSRHRELE